MGNACARSAHENKSKIILVHSVKKAQSAPMQTITTTTEEKLLSESKLAIKREARLAVRGTVRCGNRGRTDFPRHTTMSTPVVFIDGNSAPQVKGLGYWKTTMRNGSFTKTLYTPSTLRIEVGFDWKNSSK